MAELTIARRRTANTDGEPSGRALIEGSQCLYGDEVRGDDLVVANFDRKDVHTGGALYLVQSASGWRGCRRMIRTLSNEIAIDDTGRGDWVTVPNLEATTYRVVGIVETVYRPTHRQ